MKVILFTIAGMVLFLSLLPNALAENNTVTLSEEYGENEYTVLFNPLRLDNNTKPLGLEPILIGLILDQKDTVTWINQDDFPLTIKGEDDSWTTHEISPGDSGSVRFNSTGIYEFTSENNIGMNGIIAVVQTDTITHENMDQRMKITEEILIKLGHTQIDFEHVFPNIFSKEVVVSLSKDKFTDQTPATYYEEKLKNWIPFETRITIALRSDSDSEYTGFAGWSYDLESIKFHKGDVIFIGKQFHALPLDDDLYSLGNQEIAHTFHGINFQFYEKQTDDPKLDKITRVKMTFPDGNEEDILVHQPMPYRNAEDKEKDHPYFSSTTNHDLPVRPIIMSVDDETHPAYILIHKKDLSLTEQRLLGISEPSHMGCNSDLRWYLKTNGDLICVKETTFFKILERGYFGTTTVNNFDVNYYSDSIRVQDIRFDDDNEDKLLVTVENNSIRSHDTLTISIPEKLLYPKYHDEMLDEERYGLLYDGKLYRESFGWEQAKTQSHRIIGIMIDDITDTVSIIGKKMQ